MIIEQYQILISGSKYEKKYQDNMIECRISTSSLLLPPTQHPKYLIPSGRLKLLNLLPYPRRKSRAKITAEFIIKVVVAFVGHPLHRNLRLGGILQVLDERAEGLGHGGDETVLIPAITCKHCQLMIITRGGKCRISTPSNSSTNWGKTHAA